ncbi:MAG: hypothetical protein QNK37_28820 [Acidobacteriota bacterium]|nr:hypothetical protein [Acidobacteriota bacterium]
MKNFSRYALVATLLLFATFVTVQKIRAASTLQVSLNLSATCFGGIEFIDGTATASGGTAPYTFTWAGDAEQGSTPTANPNYAFVRAFGSGAGMCVTVTSADGQSKTVSKWATANCSGGGGF